MTAARIRGAIERFGWIDGIVFVAAKGLARLTAGRCRLVHYRFIAQAVPAIGKDAPRAAGAIRVERVVEGDPVVAAFPRPPEVIRRRFASGAVCLVARSGEAFAGFLWIKQERYDEDEVACTYITLPSTRASWDFDVYVDPAYRMGRTFTRLWDAGNAYLREHGIEWTFSRIHAANHASLRAHSRFEMRRVGSALFLVAGPLQLSAFTLPPYVHLSLGSRAPTVRFHAPADRPAVS